MEPTTEPPPPPRLFPPAPELNCNPAVRLKVTAAFAAERLPDLGERMHERSLDKLLLGAAASLQHLGWMAARQLNSEYHPS